MPTPTVSLRDAMKLMTAPANQGRKFWLVMREDRNPRAWTKKPSYRHYRKQDAEKEAERLCKATGMIFYVLEVISYVKPAVVEWKKL